jgi:hypothetical protein
MPGVRNASGQEYLGLGKPEVKDAWGQECLRSGMLGVRNAWSQECLGSGMIGIRNALRYKDWTGDKLKLLSTLLLLETGKSQ